MPVPLTALPELHDLEREVMREIWDRGEATVREVFEALNEREERQRAYTTVMTVCTRLFDKGLLERRQQGRGHLYLPALSRENYDDARAQAQVGALVDEFGDLALVHFSRHMDTLAPQRRQKLRRAAKRG